MIKKFVAKYKDAHNVAIFLLGDEIDAVTHHDKRYTPACMAPRYASLDNPIDKMVDDFVEMMEPLKGKIYAGTDSNHNASYRGVSGSDIHYRISQRLGFRRLGYGGWANIMWNWMKNGDTEARIGNRTRTTSIHLTHGKPTGAITKAGKMTSIERDAWFFYSDIIVHGHTHLLATPPSNIYFEPVVGKGRYRKVKQRLINSGSFLKSYSSDVYSPYSEIKRYPPIDMGWAIAEVEFFSHEPEPRITTMTKEY